MPSGLRVLVLTAPVGEGHVAAARALAEDISRANASVEVTVCDLLPALRRPLRWLVCDAYRWQLHSAPWLFGLLFAALRRSGLLRWIARTGLSLTGSRRVLRVLRRHPADVIVSTWPVATSILGCLRLRGKLRVPVCATITDFAGLELWAHRGVDLHLVMHEQLVAGVERVAGRGSARPVSPLVGARFLTPRSSTEARRALGLAADGRIVVVSGGGWAVGDLRGAVATALELEEVSVVCLAGRDDSTRIRLGKVFASEPRVTVLGFTDQMSDLLAAADVLVHSTGGVTCLESLSRGCPIVAYGAPPGHTSLLAREMAALGLVTHARSTADLRAALATARRSAAVAATRDLNAASVVLAVRPRVAARLPARLARTAASAAVLASMLFAVLASDATYPVVAEALALPESTSLSPTRHAVALVIRGDRRELLALVPLARREHLRVSVASPGLLTSDDVAALQSAGLDPIPELSSHGVSSVLGVRGELEAQVARYRIRGRFHYLAPHEGFTIGDYLLARHLDGAPLQAGYTLAGNRVDAASLHSGEVVVATLSPTRDHGQARLLASIKRLEHARVGVSSVQRLAASRAGS